MSDRAQVRDVVAVESRLSTIEDDKLAFRGIAIEELFAHSTFEETIFLLWFDQLPSRADLTAFRECIATSPPLDERIVDLIRSAAPGGLTRTLEAGVLGIGLHHGSEVDALARPVGLLTGLPDIVAAYDHIRHEQPPHPASPAPSIAERFLSAWLGHTPHADQIHAFDRGLILTADHELNAATFAARVAASTGADLVSVVLAAIATQSGPLHGGSMVEAGLLLQAALAGDPAAEIERRLTARERIPGFGHSVYRHGDPRAALFRKLTSEAAEREGDHRWLDCADQVAQAGAERVGLPPNLDLYAAAFWSALGIPADLFPAVFAIGRIAGWIAHYREQTADNRLIRPRARYIGHSGEPYIPLEERSAWFTRASMSSRR